MFGRGICAGLGAGLRHGRPRLAFSIFKTDPRQADQVVDADSTSYNTLSLVSFVAKSCLSETCSDKTGKRASQHGDERLKGGRSFYLKGKRKLSNKVTSTASGNLRDDKS